MCLSMQEYLFQDYMTYPSRGVSSSIADEKLPSWAKTSNCGFSLCVLAMSRQRERIKLIFCLRQTRTALEKARSLTNPTNLVSCFLAHNRRNCWSQWRRFLVVLFDQVVQYILFSVFGKSPSHPSIDDVVVLPTARFSEEGISIIVINQQRSQSFN